jgi:hypothetical protein
MANTSSPFGFRQFQQREGSAPTAGLETALVSSAQTTPIFTGDVVVRSSAAQGYITTAGASGAITTQVYGIFQGCEYYNSNVGRVTWNSFWPGSGATGDVKAYVCNNPEQLYIAQGSSNGVLGSTVVGWGVPFSITGSSQGNTLSGQSVMTVVSSQVTALSSNSPFVIVGLYSDYAPPGVNGTSTGAEGLQIVVVQQANAARKTVSVTAQTS